MTRKRVQFGEFEVPIPWDHERITDRDATTDYLFINAPDEIYTLCFDSGMPLYGKSSLSGREEYSSMELKLTDRKISFFCPFRTGAKPSALWYFSIEFQNDEGESLILPGQVMMEYGEVYRRAVNGKLPFIEILEHIKLKRGVCSRERDRAAKGERQ